MSETLAPPAVTLGAVAVTAPEFLRHLKLRGRLQPLLQEAVVEHYLVQQAAQAGQAVTPEELQRAADLVRQHQGLTSAEETRASLARRGLSVVEFEDALERDLLLDKLKDHLCKDRIATHFAQHRPQYDRLRLRQLTVPREDLARELLSQVQDDGRDFAELAREHLAHTATGGSPDVAVLLRRQLFPGVAAALPTTAGEVVGPVPTPHGFALVRLEEVQPAELDPATGAVIRQELFEAWLQQQLAQLPLRYPLLDELT